MQQLNYATYYTKFGVRNLQQLMAPRVFPVSLLQLPLESIVHYLDFDGISVGPMQTDPLYRNMRAQIPVKQVRELKITVGAPRPAVFDRIGLVGNYFKKNRHMRDLKEAPIPAIDRRTPVVMNYALLARAYRYQQTQISAYQRDRNLLATALDTASKLLDEQQKNHFFFFDAPKLMPSIKQLDSAILTPTMSSLKYFNDPASMLILELWKWLTRERAYAIDTDQEDSIFKFLPESKCHMVNFVFQESGKWLVLNLGVLNSFRKTGVFKGEVESAAESRAIKSSIAIDPVQLGKRMLHFFISVNSLRSLATVGTDKEVVEPVIAASGDEEEDDDVEFIGDTSVDEAVPEPKIIDEVKTAEIIDAIDGDSTANMDSMGAAELAALLSAQDEQINEELSQIDAVLSQVTQRANEQKPSLNEVAFAPAAAEPHDAIVRMTDRLLEDSAITPNDAYRLKNLATKYESIQMPNGQNLGEFSKVKPEMLSVSEDEKSLVTDSYALPDERMRKSTLNAFDSKYVSEVMARDTAGMVLAVQNFGVAVTGYHVERQEDILGAYDAYAIRLAPVRGQPSTIRFKVPVVKPDGVYTSNGVPYRLRKQRVDLPIRKTGPNTVALVSYYGKAFITRGRLASNDYGRWMEKAITSMIINHDPRLVDPMLSDVSDYQYKASRQYTTVSKIIKSVSIEGVYYCFDHNAILEDEFVKLNHTVSPQTGATLIGYNRDAVVWYYARQDGSVYSLDNSGALEEVGTIESIFGLDVSQAPYEYTSVKVFAQEIPIGVVLGMEMGLSNLIELLGVEHRYEITGTRLKLAPDEVAITFNDRVLVFSRKNRLASLVLCGFTEFSKHLRNFSVFSFDNRSVYQNLLESADMSAKYIRELDLMFAMFVDPISKEILEKMGEPTTFKGLLFRANQMLLDDTHPELMDPKFMRIRGYERIPGAVYTELVNSLRAHNGKPGKQAAQIEQHPYAVWTRIAEDPAKMQVQEINPIKAIKETEAATYAGTGGRMKRAMTRGTRAYHPNDMGVISESTVDNSDVGINVNLSANPKLVDLRGMQGDFSMEDDGATSLLSTSAMLAPFSNFDDPKRVNFVAIQQEHAVACEGYHQASVRTGYDLMVAERTSELFAVVAKKPGTVRSINKKGIIVDYDDGTDAGYELGRRFGSAAGLTIAHKVITNLKAGEKFQVGEAICYNSGFFTQDFFDPKRIVLKNAVEATTALLESADTHEDSSAISVGFSKKLSTSIGKVKVIQVGFDQKVSGLVEVGQVVDADSVLCYIEDSVTADTGLFTDANIETLRAIGAQAPRAKVKGVVEKIEFFYHGDKEDMSASVLDLANRGDAELKAQAKAKGSQYYSGKVDGGFRIDANQLPMDYMAIRVYITSTIPSGVGDKGVFANQMKTVHCRVFETPITTEAGTEVDAIFGMKSIEARIVHSPIKIGTTARLMHELGKAMVGVYRGKK